METPTTDWLHLLWAAVAALWWKLWGSNEKKVTELEHKVDRMNDSVVKHGVLHQTTAEAIGGLRESMKECADESRKQSEALVRIETILQTAVKGKE